MIIENKPNPTVDPIGTSRATVDPWDPTACLSIWRPNNNSSLLLNRLTPIPSQMFLVHFNQHPLRITLDSGATVSYIRMSEVSRLGINVMPNNQLALLADRQTRMASIGEIDVTVQVENINLRLRALVMQNLQADCFGGTTFHVDNEIETKITEGSIRIHNKYVVKQCNPCTNMPVNPPIN